MSKRRRPHAGQPMLFRDILEPMVAPGDGRVLFAVWAADENVSAVRAAAKRLTGNVPGG